MHVPASMLAKPVSKYICRFRFDTKKPNYGFFDPISNNSAFNKNLNFMMRKETGNLKFRCWCANANPFQRKPSNLPTNQAFEQCCLCQKLFSIGTDSKLCLVLSQNRPIMTRLLAQEKKEPVHNLWMNRLGNLPRRCSSGSCEISQRFSLLRADMSPS